VKLKDGNSCFLSLLLEHKSYKDELAPLQILTYLGNAYQQQIKNKEPLTLILPVIYYHGKESWEPKGVDFLFNKYPKNLLKYLPKFNMELIDLASLS